MARRSLQLLMRMFSYIVARDYGFAPNPFHGWCTLATCMPRIRRGAAVGDWVVGTGAKTKYGLKGHLLYAMKVEEAMGFDLYWNDARFLSKRPILNGSLKQVYGDNIYHLHQGRWIQADSHHSLDDGRPNRKNIEHDTTVDRVLLGQQFVYFGSDAPLIPKRFRAFGATEEDICCPGRGHRVASSRLANAFERWLVDRGTWGLQGMPLEFEGHRRSAVQKSGSSPGRRRRAQGK